MITVTVHLGTILQKKTPEGVKRRLEVALEEDSSLLDLIEYLDLELDPGQLLLAVNGRGAELTHILADQDRVHLMMPISGG
jgi:sulfur carrier protein ThiS